MPELIVNKFGGSCLRDKGDIDRIGQLVSSFDAKPVIVVSALCRWVEHIQLQW